jgi:hypothetical protein
LFNSNYYGDHDTQGIHCPIVVVAPNTDDDLLGGVRREEGGGRKEVGGRELLRSGTRHAPEAL